MTPDLRLILCVLGVVPAVGVGGLTVNLVAEGAYEFLVTHAPGYFPGRYSSVIQLSTPEFDAPRKIGWGYLKFYSTIVGTLAFAAAISLIVLLRLGGIMSILRAYLIIVLSALAGGCAGGGIGYLLGRFSPGYYRSVFRAGGEPWFDPQQVGIGLGVSQGLLVGVLVGAVVVVAVSWYRARLPAAAKSPKPA